MIKVLQIKIVCRAAAIASRFRLCLPSYGPGFESQAHHLRFIQFIKLSFELNCEKNEKRGRDWPLKNSFALDTNIQPPNHPNWVRLNDKYNEQIQTCFGRCQKRIGLLIFNVCLNSNIWALKYIRNIQSSLAK